MDFSFRERFFTTKEAADSSGYTADYVARLLRSGRVEGQKVGHNWFVEKKSLNQFLLQQQASGVAVLAYDSPQILQQPVRKSVQRKSTFSDIFAPAALSEDVSDHILDASYHSHSRALGIAIAVVLMGVAAGQTAILPSVSQYIAYVGQETQTGFAAAFGALPAVLAEHLQSQQDALRAHTNDTTLLPSFADTPSLTLDETTRQVSSTGYAAPHPIIPTHTNSQLAAAAFASAGQSVSTAYATLRSPARAVQAASDTYLSLGMAEYAGIAAAFEGYRSFARFMGAQVYAVAVLVHRSITATPGVLTRIGLVTGNAVVGATHAAINADVALAYGIATAAPETAQTLTLVTGNTGAILAGAAAALPQVAVGAYRQVTAAPATFAPALAERVWSVEFAAADRFLTWMGETQSHYLAFLTTAGRLTYEGTSSAGASLAGAASALFVPLTNTSLAAPSGS